MCANFRPALPERLAPFGFGRPALATGEAYPGRPAPFLCNLEGGIWLEGGFGLMPHWAKPSLALHTYNARSETVAEKPSFRNAWRHRQLAIIPMEAFFEPYYAPGAAKSVRWRIERIDGEPFGVAGLWERRPAPAGGTEWSFTLLTINADGHPLMQQFHKPGDEKRTIVPLAPADWNAWLSAKSDPEIREMLQGFDPGEFRAMEDPRPAGRAKAQAE
jgi:putative SOS response-associated peptidase YedK